MVRGSIGVGHDKRSAVASLDADVRTGKNDWFKLSAERNVVHVVGANFSGDEPIMHEAWLNPNRRALWFGCIPPLVIAALGAWLAIRSRTIGGNAAAWIGATLVILSAAVLVALVRQFSRPRIAYRDGHILFNLRSGAPIAVPAHVVEAFFLGQGPAHLPGDYRGQEKTVNLVARLAQRETAWAHRDVRQALGNWSDGYVTVRGTWCEPLDSEVVRRLNRRLKEVQTCIDANSSDAASD